MLLHLTELSQEPLYRQISRQIGERIVRGEMVEGTELPPARTMARAQHVSLYTVRRAYDALHRDGLIEHRGGTDLSVASLTPRQKLLTAAREPHGRYSPLTMVQALSRELASALDREELMGTMEDHLRHHFRVESVYFALSNDGRDEYAFLPSDDFPTPCAVRRDDPAMNAMTQSVAPLGIETLQLSPDGSPLLRELLRRHVRIIVPLNEQPRQFVGFVALSDRITDETYSAEDRSLLAVLADQFVTALTRARFHTEAVEMRRIESELMAARRVQADLLPKVLPDNDGISVAAQCTPSRVVGGDFYDCIPLDGNRCAVVISDACGNGLPAAMLMSQTQAMLRSELNNGNSIQRILANMNEQMVASTPQDRFVTLFCGVLDEATGECEYVNAGHWYPILVRRDGRSERLETGGLALGLLAEATYETGCVTLDDGDILFFFTDGLTETRDGTHDEYGEERLLTVLSRCRSRGAREIVDAVLEDVTAFSGVDLPQDDRTILALKVGHVGMNERYVPFDDHRVAL